MRVKLEMKQKIQNRSTGVIAISQHLVHTIDYIHGALLIHYMCDNTNMIELAHLVTVVPHYIYTTIKSYKFSNNNS